MTELEMDMEGLDDVFDDLLDEIVEHEKKEEERRASEILAEKEMKLNLLKLQKKFASNGDKQNQQNHIQDKENSDKNIPNTCDEQQNCVQDKENPTDDVQNTDDKNIQNTDDKHVQNQQNDINIENQQNGIKVKENPTDKDVAKKADENCIENKENTGDNHVDMQNQQNDIESQQNCIKDKENSQNTGDVARKEENRIESEANTGKVVENELSAWIRSMWKAGSFCEIYSNSGSRWFKGNIQKIFNDSEGEWLEVEYINGDKSIRCKQTPRGDISAIRPLSKAMSIYKYVYNAILTK